MVNTFFFLGVGNEKDQLRSFESLLGGFKMKFFSNLSLSFKGRAAIYCYLILLLLLVQNGSVFAASNYLVGLGSYDITGPAADVNMMGYANSEQTAAGVHFRLRARAFIVAEPQGNNRGVFVNLDACMASQLVTIKVLERLKAR